MALKSVDVGIPVPASRHLLLAAGSKSVFMPRITDKFNIRQPFAAEVGVEQEHAEQPVVLAGSEAEVDGEARGSAAIADDGCPLARQGMLSARREASICR